jgi:hypothetical protein
VYAQEFYALFRGQLAYGLPSPGYDLRVDAQFYTIEPGVPGPTEHSAKRIII